MKSGGIEPLWLNYLLIVLRLTVQEAFHWKALGGERELWSRANPNLHAKLSSPQIHQCHLQAFQVWLLFINKLLIF